MHLFGVRGVGGELEVEAIVTLGGFNVARGSVGHAESAVRDGHLGIGGQGLFVLRDGLIELALLDQRIAGLDEIGS